MKIYILIILFFTLTAAGFVKAGALHRKVYETDGLITFITLIKDKVSYFRTPLYILLSQACNENKRYRVILSFGESLKEESNIKRAWQNVDCENILGEEACRIADEFFSSLGTSGISGQTGLCDATLHRLELCRQKALEETENKAKLYKSLGFLAGAFAVIMFV